MPVLKFNTPPAGKEIAKGKYGETTGLQQAHGDHYALAHTLGGEPLNHAQGVHPNAGPAVLSTQPYHEPKPKDRVGRCAGNDDTCNAWAHKGTGYCLGHEKSLGLK